MWSAKTPSDFKINKGIKQVSPPWIMPNVLLMPESVRQRAILLFIIQMKLNNTTAKMHDAFFGALDKERKALFNFVGGN